MTEGTLRVLCLSLYGCVFALPGIALLEGFGSAVAVTGSVHPLPLRDKRGVSCDGFCCSLLSRS